MRRATEFRLPPEQKHQLKRATLYAWVTILYLISVVILLYVVMGTSQAMKAAWLEDTLSLVPPIMFLMASAFFDKPANARFPYGYHRIVIIGYMVASVALLGMGLYIVYDSAVALLAAEHPTIGLMTVFGYELWAGWVMIGALVWSVVPVFFLGRVKKPLARKLHNKVLYADAMMNKADWLTGAAAIVGILGIGFGLWWADAAAAILIGIDVAHDGIKHSTDAVNDLMDTIPTSVDHERTEPVVAQVQDHLRSLPWVAEAHVRLREEGHAVFGEGFVVPRDPNDPTLLDKLERAAQSVSEIDWKIHDVQIVPVTEIPDHLIGEDPPLGRFGDGS